MENRSPLQRLNINNSYHIDREVESYLEALVEAGKTDHDYPEALQIIRARKAGKFPELSINELVKMYLGKRVKAG